VTAENEPPIINTMFDATKSSSVDFSAHRAGLTSESPRFIFVCHPPLTPKALLLAASLRRVFGKTPTLVAAIPQPKSTWGDIGQRIKTRFEELNVRLISIRQPFGTKHRPANKIAALACCDERPAFLLDSDVLCLSAPAFAILENAELAAKPADMLGFNPGIAKWNELYAVFGLLPPTTRVKTTVSNQETPPYYNAGVVFFRHPKSLAHKWLEVCSTISTDTSLPSRFMWLDQIALPIAAKALGRAVVTLDERWNFPVHLRPLDGGAFPYFVHYHNLDNLFRIRALRQFTDDLIGNWPFLQDVIKTPMLAL